MTESVPPGEMSTRKALFPAGDTEMFKPANDGIAIRKTSQRLAIQRMEGFFQTLEKFTSHFSRVGNGRISVPFRARNRTLNRNPRDQRDYDYDYE